VFNACVHKVLHIIYDTIKVALCIWECPISRFFFSFNSEPNFNALYPEVPRNVDITAYMDRERERLCKINEIGKWCLSGFAGYFSALKVPQTDNT